MFRSSRVARRVRPAFVFGSLLPILAGCAALGGGEDPTAKSVAAVTTTTLFGPTALSKGASKTGVYTVTVAGAITFRTSGSGDADLYLRKGAAASPSAYDCASETSTAAEQCTVTVAVGDRVYWDVYGYAAATVSLVVETPDATSSTSTITLLPTTSIARGASKTGTYTSTTSGQLTFRTTGSGDADLYVKKGASASPSSHDCASETSTANETCVVTVAAGDTIAWDVYAYAAATVSLTVDVPSNAPPPPPPPAQTTTIPIFATTSLARGANLSGSYVADASGSVAFDTAGTGDADLYVRKGAAASPSQHDCASESSTATEHCAVSVAAGDRVYWYVYGYAASSVRMDATVPVAAPSVAVPLPPNMQYCSVSGACAATTPRVLGCASGQSTCSASRSTTVRWSINGAPVSAMGVDLLGTTNGITPVLPGDATLRTYGTFVVANGLSALQLASDLDMTIGYYGLAPVWGGTTSLDFVATSQTAAHGTSTLYRWPTYDVGTTHDALVQSIEKIAADEIATTGITPPLYQAFFMPSELAVSQGVEGGLAFGDGRIEINYGNPDWIAAQPGGAPAICAHEFAHEHTHTLFAQIASKFTGNPSCLNEGLADGLGHFVGAISEADFQRTADGSDLTQTCSALTEVHARGKCVLWHLEQSGYFSASLFAKLFAPQHTFAFDSCDMTSPVTGNAYVVYLTEATGADMSGFVTSLGWPNAGSYAAAKTALGL